MTKEEAIELIECMSMAFVPTDQYGDYDDPEPYEEAVNMAIEALSTERAWWIPVSKELPKEDGLYFVQLDFNDEFGRKYKFTCRWADGWNCFRRRGDGVIVKDHEIKNVVAWMELPDDYEDGDTK